MPRAEGIHKVRGLEGQKVNVASKGGVGDGQDGEPDTGVDVASAIIGLMHLEARSLHTTVAQHHLEAVQIALEQLPKCHSTGP